MKRLSFMAAFFYIIHPNIMLHVCKFAFNCHINFNNNNRILPLTFCV